MGEKEIGKVTAKTDDIQSRWRALRDCSQFDQDRFCPSLISKVGFLNDDCVLAFLAVIGERRLRESF